MTDEIKRNITKLDLVNELAIPYEMPQEKMERLFDSFLGIIKSKVSSGNEIEIRGFGSFRIVKTKAKTARNISKGTVMIVPPGFVIKFRPSKYFRILKYPNR